MNLHFSGEEDMQAEYDRGYDAGLTEGVNMISDHADQSYQQGQVAMKTKVLEVVQRYYGSSVYENIKELVNRISLE